MNQSYSESDMSLSPSQVLERLHMLRQVQLLQQGKLLKQRQLYQDSSRNSTITEVVSQFSASTSFNTFRSLLESSESSTNVTPRLHSSKSPQVSQQDLMEGVAVLNLSQESEFIINSPVSSRSKTSSTSQPPIDNSVTVSSGAHTLAAKKQISLDEMPILSPKQDFEALIIEKLKNELDAPKPKILQKENNPPSKGKKPFLKRGEGMARFGIKKHNPVIQSTQALPWKQALNKKNMTTKSKLPENSKRKSVDIQIVVTEPKQAVSTKPIVDKIVKSKETHHKSPTGKVVEYQKEGNSKHLPHSVDSNNCELHAPKPISPPREREVKIQQPKGKHPLLANKGKTWAAVLNKEQDNFLRQLKQSDYYKNFTSPAKSILSDISCDETLVRLRQEREMAEQNMFELLENKVDHNSFNINNSFINRFLQGSNLECSGESTPLIMQKCIANNPELMRIFPDVHQNRNDNCQSDAESCNSEYTECYSEACSSACSCSCNNTVEEPNNPNSKKNTKKKVVQHDKSSKTTKEVEKQPEIEKCHNDKEIDSMKENMADMNAKLVATSELLKDRLRELEDEIETFRKENANLTKMREEIDMEKQKFYEEKSTFEQKFNEEKILSEYYLAEEKEKLTKQKQIYDRQVREMRGRLNKKDKDEVANLKREINDLKEEIRLKDAKSTTITARLRNQLKIIEKEKKELQEEIEKLKKENRRIQHSNDITRRMTNIKYLEEVNKKLANFQTKSCQSQVVLDDNMKYKTLEIERQSRSTRVQPAPKNPLRTRAKSVPNLNVTSRYAKYFSQRDVLSPTERNQTLNIERYPSGDGDNGCFENEVESLGDTESLNGKDATDIEDENSLEKIYMERFQEHPKDIEPTGDVHKSRSIHSSSRHSFERNNVNDLEKHNHNENPDDFFIRRSDSNSSSIRDTKSQKQISPHYTQPSGSNSNRSKSPVSILSHRSNDRKSPISITRDYKPDYLSSHSSRANHSQGRSNSPVSIHSNNTYSCSSQRLPTVINRDQYSDNRMISPEPNISKTSITKTDLNPTEIRKLDGSKELRFPNGNVKYLSADGKYSKFVYYNGDIKENFFNEGRIKYYYAEMKTFHTTHPDGLEVLEFADGQVEKRYKDGSSEIRLPNGSVRYFDPKSVHVREEWRFPDGATLTVSAGGDRRVVFPSGQVEVHTKDHKRREFPDGTVKLVYNDGTAETRYASGRVRIKDKHGNLIMDSVPG